MFNFIKRIALFFILIGILVGAVAPAFAQQENPPVIVLPEGTPSLDVAVTGIVAMLYALFSQPFLAPLNTFLVGLSKKSVFLKRYSGATLKFAWAAILFAAWMVAQKLGFGLQFESGVGVVNSILATFGTYILGVTATSYFSGKAHSLAVANDIPILGSTRPSRAEQIINAPQAVFVDGDLTGNG